MNCFVLILSFHDSKLESKLKDLAQWLLTGAKSGQPKRRQMLIVPCGTAVKFARFQVDGKLPLFPQDLESDKDDTPAVARGDRIDLIGNSRGRILISKGK